MRTDLLIVISLICLSLMGCGSKTSAQSSNTEVAYVCVTAHVYSDYSTMRAAIPQMDQIAGVGWWENNGYGNDIHFVKGDMKIAGHEFIHALIYESRIAWGDPHFDKDWSANE